MNHNSNIFENAEFDPEDIIDNDDMDEDYKYDLWKKNQEPKKRVYYKYQLKKSLSLLKRYWWAIVTVILIYKVYDHFTYNTYSYYTKSFHDIEDSDLVSIPEETILSIYHDRLLSKSIDWSKYAYVLYATNINYLCACFMVFNQLRNNYRTRAQLILFYNNDMTDADSRDDYQRFLQEFESIAANLGITLVPLEKNIVDEDVDDLNFRSSFNKLSVFEYEKYPILQNFSKIIYIDSDILLNGKLDELFFLPDDFDVAMPIAYWLVKPEKNYKNLLTSYPSIEPNFASSELRKLNYFRIQENLQDNLKWSTALMVIKPSRHLSDAIAEGLSSRLTSDYDMDIINDVLEHHADLRRLTIPHKNYFMITGDIFLTLGNRYLYLADPVDLQFINERSIKMCYNWYGGLKTKAPYWCKVEKSNDYLSVAKKAKIVHFSDFPLPKPWVQSYIKVTCQKRFKDQRNWIYVKECSDYNFWGNYHNTFINSRLDVCHLYQETEVI